MCKPGNVLTTTQADGAGPRVTVCHRWFIYITRACQRECTELVLSEDGRMDMLGIGAIVECKKLTQKVSC